MSQGSIHEQTSIPGHTPLYWREWLSIIMVRYGARMLEGGLENYAKKTGNKQLADWVKKDDGNIVDITAGTVSTLSFFEHFANSAKTIKKMFAETVALEKGKDPDKVGFFDLLSSKNDVVKKTIGNYFYFNSLRFMSSALFFVRPLARLALNLFPGMKLEEGQQYNDAHNPPSKAKVFMDILANTSAWELGLAATGLLYYFEQKRSMTVFETLHRLVAESFNYDRTLEVKPNVNAVYNVFQTHQQAMKSGKTIQDGGLKEEAKVIFQRITELFEQSYNAKEANFKLPQYLHLLGFNKIDPQNVEKTLLYVEAMNTGGVKAVSEVDKKLAEGKDVQAVAKECGVVVSAHAFREKYKHKHTPVTSFVDSAKNTEVPGQAQANLAFAAALEEKKKSDKGHKGEPAANKLLEEVESNKITSQQKIQ